jgi:hypothetical protein
MKIDEKRDAALNAIGWELADLRLSGKLDFQNFKSLFERALIACGDDTDPLEMFMARAHEPEWGRWIWDRLAARRASRVA